MASMENATPEEEDAERMRYYHAKYISYSRAVGVMWSVLTVSHLIIALVALVQPTWIGNDEGTIRFGLWKYTLTTPGKLYIK